MLSRTLASKLMLRSYSNTNLIERCPQFRWNVKSLLCLPMNECTKYALLVLNAPIHYPESALLFWKNAAFRMAIDGGGNRIHDLLSKFRVENKEELLPHVVSGDFDSIRNDVLTMYKNRNVKIICTPNQDETDFFKGLKEASSLTEATTVMVLCESDGRFDHIMSNVNTLFKAVENNSTKRFSVFLLGKETLTWLLQPGSHILEIPSELWTEKSHCALIPAGQPCMHVSTTGLKWNLNDNTLKFGALVSSSNTYDVSRKNPVVTVHTDSNIIWSMGIN